MKKIFFFLFMAVAASNNAQTALGMSQIIPVNLVDTVTAGSSHSHTVYVKNTGNTVFNDSITIYTAVDDSLLGFSIVDVYNSNSIISLNPGDSAAFALTAVYNLSPTGYKTGVDIIVVWPYATNATITDSLTYSVYIIDPNGINELNIYTSLKVFPNPAKDHVLIDAIENKKIKSIRLIDTKGCSLNIELNGSIINVENLSEGIYILDIELENNQHRYGKFIKQ
ncbi:MAG: T9SS type A sorting domain-containing protein [Bacteroidia bacterium]|nr:T9SS type A sorting domain-containing protein [Bacteroidia bacterium]